MVQNIDSILQRGERLDLLVDKTDTLAGQAYAFRRGARSVRRQQWWKNTRITALTGVVVLVSCSVCDMVYLPWWGLPFDRTRLRNWLAWRSSLTSIARSVQFGSPSLRTCLSNIELTTVDHHLCLYRSILRSVALALFEQRLDLTLGAWTGLILWDQGWLPRQGTWDSATGQCRHPTIDLWALQSFLFISRHGLASGMAHGQCLVVYMYANHLSSRLKR